MVFSVRTLFLFIRGIDQSGRAMDSASKGIKELITNEKLLAEVSQRLMFAGAAFLTFGMMAAGALGKIIADTERGSVYMDDFAIAIGRLKTAFANAFLERHGDELENIIYQLDQLAQNDRIMNFVVDLAFAVTETLIQTGGVLLAAGIAGKLLAMLATLFKAGGALSWVAGSAGIATALGTLGTIVIGVAVAIAVASIIWNLLPETWRDSINDFAKDLQKKAGDVGMQMDFLEGDLGDMTDPTNQAIMNDPWLQTAMSVNANNGNAYLDTTIENLNVVAEDEDIEKAGTNLIFDAWMRTGTVPP